MVTGSNPARSLGNLYSAYPTPIKIPSCFQAHMNLSFRSPPLGLKYKHRLQMSRSRKISNKSQNSSPKTLWLIGLVQKKICRKSLYFGKSMVSHWFSMISLQPMTRSWPITWCHGRVLKWSATPCWTCGKPSWAQISLPRRGKTKHGAVRRDGKMGQ